jgi:hypothetical protein
MTIKWNCERKECYVKKVLPDWSMLNGCFGDTRVSASDLDGWIHQNGRVLFLEKKFPNGDIDERLKRTIGSLVQQGNSMIVIWCEEPDGSDISKMRVFNVIGYDSKFRVDATLADFRMAVQTWWQSVYEPGKV